MYFISLIGFVAAILFVLACNMGINPSQIASRLVDFPSLVMMALLAVPILLASGMLKDFFKAFAIAFNQKKEYSLMQLKRSEGAVTLTIQIFLYGGALCTLLGFITSLYEADTLEMLGISLAVALLTLVYAFVFAILLLGVRGILRRKIMEIMEE